MPSSRASSSPRSSGAGRSLCAPAQRLAEHAARDREMRGDRLLGAVAARGQPVGDREQRDVDLDGRAGAQVGEHRARAPAAGARARESRAAGDGARAPRRARAGAHSRAGGRAPRARARRRATSCPMKVTRPSAARVSRVSGLAASCSSAPQRSASPRVSPSASGSASSALDRASARAIARARSPAGGSPAASARRVRSSTSSVWP